MIFLKVKARLFLLSFFISAISGQNNFLWVQDGTGNSVSSNNPISIILANEDTLGGFQFTLNYDTSFIRIDSVIIQSEIEYLDVYTSESQPGAITVISVDMDGDGINPGYRTVFDLLVMVENVSDSGSVLLELTDVTFSDNNGYTISGISGDGYFFVNDFNAIRVQNSIQSISVNLYNNFLAGGVQFSVDYDITMASLDSIYLTERSDYMDLSYSESTPGTITILLYSFTQGSIESGSGTIVEILLNNLDETSTSFDISFSDVFVSDVQGNTVEMNFFEGNYFILDPSIIIQPPLISDIEDVSMAEDDSLRIPLIASDLNVADSLSFSAVSDSDEVDLQIINNDTLLISPEENWFGTTTITAIVTDGLFNDSTSFIVTVIAVNDAPVANAATATTNEDTNYSGTLSASDIDGDTLTYSILTNPLNGTVSITSSLPSTSVSGFTYAGSYGNSIYFISNNSMSGAVALETCATLGGHLATISSAEENTYLTSLISVGTWIGLNDLAVEGTFVWVTGEPVVYTNWDSGEPNNNGAFGNEDYVELLTNGTWNDHQYVASGTVGLGNRLLQHGAK